jgi:hypothetical protein
MKTKTIGMINGAAEAGRLALVGAYNALRTGMAGNELWFRLAPYGEFPQTIQTERGPRRIVQLVDRESADALAANFRSLTGRTANFFRGVPIYEGHPDDRAWREENPGVKAKAVGRIKEIEVRDDGPWARAVFNDEGAEMITGEAAAYSGQSPHWRMEEVPGKPGAYRPVLLMSVGLLNTPNIAENAIGINDGSGTGAPEAGGRDGEKPENRDQKPDGGGAAAPTTTTNNEMDKKLLERLGLKPEASEEAIAQAVNAALDRADAAEAAKADAETKLAAANSAKEEAEKTAGELRSKAIETAVESAVNDGRIAEADKERWTGALNADYEGESRKLAALMPVLNTENRLKDAGSRKAEGAPGGDGIAAINAAMASYAKEHGLNLRDGADYDAAYRAVRESKPELFG